MEHVKSSVEVFLTGDYARFRMLKGNRQLNEAKIKRILKDINEGIDVLKYYPIQVTQKGDVLEIIDGQHRFYISRKLKRPVYYIILDEDRSLPDIAKINSNVEKWKTDDFINCYVQQGNQNYELLQKFLDTYHFSVTTSIKLLTTGNPGTESGLGNVHTDFQRGLLKVCFYDEAVRIAEMCKLFEAYPVWKERGFVIALYRIHEAGKVTIGDLLDKVNKHPEMLQKQTGFKEYIYNLESIYNRLKQTRTILY